MSDNPEDILANLSPEDKDRLLRELMAQKMTPSSDPPENVEGKAEVGDNNYGQNIGVNLGIAIFGRDPREDERRRLVWYLDTLASELNQLPLRGLQTNLDNQGQGVNLASVYVVLATEGREVLARGQPDDLEHYLDPNRLRRGGGEASLQAVKSDYGSDHALPDQAVIQIDRDIVDQGQRQHVTLWRARLATEAVQKQQRLVLLGEPGSGKSTFVRHLAWLLAQRELGNLTHQQAAPLTTWTTPTMPLLLPCQRLARRLATEGCEARTVVAALKAELQRFAAEHDTMLREALHQGAALLLFDGLDEVPIQTDPTRQADRLTTLDTIRTFAATYQRTPIVVTCRVLAFTPDLRTKLGWPVETLAPFSLGQVQAFVPAWYNELVAKRQLARDTAERLQKMLVQRIMENRQLREMSATPLLLTMMALVLYNKGELPRDRPQLYEDILEVLLGQWDKVKEGETLADVIGKPEWNSDNLRPPLHQLSYEAHASGSEDGRGRLRRESVRDALIAFFEEAQLPAAWEAARRCLDYIEQRSGLLMPDENQSYVFAHLTLQEHCAGCHMTLEREDVLDQVLSHRADDRWHVPIMLGMGLADPRDQRDVLEALLDQNEAGQAKPVARWYRDLILAAEIGKDRDWQTLRTRPHLKTRVDGYQTALRTGLATLLNDATQPLPVAERVRAGFLLGDLGDPRYPVTIEQWKAEAEKVLGGNSSGYFCKVEPGTYVIGSSDADPDARKDEKPQHTVTFEQPFWIARLPITNAQWQAWVAAGGKQSFYADDSNLNHPNQPVVGVRWYWCRDFCRWLSEQTGLTIRLPSEAEWEAAARGGDAWRYPWGNDWRADHAATAEDQETRGTHWSTPVGCYPAGAAPGGALDMAGNVWEWTHTPWAENHDPPRSTERADDAKLFTLKQGGYRNNRTYVRCAARNWSYPIIRGDDINGFRVLLSPRVQ